MSIYPEGKIWPPYSPGHEDPGSASTQVLYLPDAVTAEHAPPATPPSEPDRWAALRQVPDQANVPFVSMAAAALRGLKADHSNEEPAAASGLVIDSHTLIPKSGERLMRPADPEEARSTLSSLARGREFIDRHRAAAGKGEAQAPSAPETPAVTRAPFLG